MNLKFCLPLMQLILLICFQLNLWNNTFFVTITIHKYNLLTVFFSIEHNILFLIITNICPVPRRWNTVLSKLQIIFDRLWIVCFASKMDASCKIEYSRRCPYARKMKIPTAFKSFISINWGYNQTKLTPWVDCRISRWYSRIVRNWLGKPVFLCYPELDFESQLFLPCRSTSEVQDPTNSTD